MQSLRKLQIMGIFYVQWGITLSKIELDLYITIPFFKGSGGGGCIKIEFLGEIISNTCIDVRI